MHQQRREQKARQTAQATFGTEFLICELTVRLGFKVFILCVSVHVRMQVCLWHSEDSFLELILSLRRVGSGDGTRVVVVIVKHLYLLSPLTSPKIGFSLFLWGFSFLFF